MATSPRLRVVGDKGDLAAESMKVVPAGYHVEVDTEAQDVDPPWAYHPVPDVPADANTGAYALGDSVEATVREGPLARLIAGRPDQGDGDTDSDDSFPQVSLDELAAQRGAREDLGAQAEAFFAVGLDADRPNGRHYEDPVESGAPKSAGRYSSRLRSRTIALGLASAVGLTLYGLVSALSTGSPTPVAQATGASVQLEAKVGAGDFTKVPGKRGTLFRYTVSGDATHQEVVEGFNTAYGATCNMNVGLADLIYANGRPADVLTKGGRVYLRVPKESPCYVQKQSAPSAPSRRAHRRQHR